MRWELHVRFCERPEGEVPSGLLDHRRVLENPGDLCQHVLLLAFRSLRVTPSSQTGRQKRERSAGIKPALLLKARLTAEGATGPDNGDYSALEPK